MCTVVAVRHRLYGVSSQVKAVIDGCLIHDQRFELRAAFGRLFLFARSMSAHRVQSGPPAARPRKWEGSSPTVRAILQCGDALLRTLTRILKGSSPGDLPVEQPTPRGKQPVRPISGPPSMRRVVSVRAAASMRCFRSLAFLTSKSSFGHHPNRIAPS